MLFRFSGQLCHELRLYDDLIAYKSLTFAKCYSSLDGLFEFHADVQGISGDHLLLEPDRINAHEVQQVVFRIRHAAQQQDASDLGEGFDLQNSGHDGLIRKMACKKSLVHGHILETHYSFTGYDLQNSIDEQKWITMGQKV